MTQTTTGTGTRTGSVTVTNTASQTASDPYNLTATLTGTATMTAWYYSWNGTSTDTTTNTATTTVAGPVQSSQPVTQTETATLTNSRNGTDTQTATLSVTGYVTYTGTATVTVTNTVTSQYGPRAGTGTRTVTATGTAVKTGSVLWTWVTSSTATQTGTLPNTATATGTETASTTRTETGTGTVTATGTATGTVVVTMPSPATIVAPTLGQTGVSILTSPVLRWSAGSGAADHEILFAECPDPTNPPALQSRGRVMNTFYNFTTAYPFQGSTTYCWRIDERNAAGKTEGSVWYFTTEPPRLPGKAVLSSPADGSTNLSISPTLNWRASIPAPMSHDVYLGKTRALDEPGDFKGNQALDYYKPSRLDGSTTYYWRIDEKNAAGTTTGDVWSFTTGTSVLPGLATGPTPADGAENVSITPTPPTLRWTPGSGAAGQTVYLGDSASTMKSISPAGFSGTATSIATTITQPGTYFWRVDASNTAGTKEGTTWKFTTVLPSVEPVQAKIARCEHLAEPDATGGGRGHSPAKRPVILDFGYAARNKVDDKRKGQSVGATKRVELCIVDGAGAVTCNAATNPKWLLYDSVTKPSGDFVPNVDKVLDSSDGAFPPGLYHRMRFRIPDVDPTKDLDYANKANKGKFAILRVNGQSTDDARKLGGTCPLPYLIDDSQHHYEIYGTEDTVADPWAGKGFGDKCKSGGLYAGHLQCISPAAVANVLLYLEGFAGEATQAWAESRFGATSKFAWRNGNDPAVCGDCKGHVSVNVGAVDGYGGMNYGPGLLSLSATSYSTADDWTNPGPLSITLHEMFHALQATYGSQHIGFVEGTAALMDARACIRTLTQVSRPNFCLSTGHLGAGQNSGFMLQPGLNVLSMVYDSSSYWRYFMEQYALPTHGYGPYARPEGGEAAEIESDPNSFLGHDSRHPDEGADLIRRVLEAVENAVKSGNSQPNLLQLADGIVSTRVLRNLDNLVLDFHTAALLKDYKGVPVEWRFEWVGDFNAAPAGSKVKLYSAAKKDPNDPIEDLKPFDRPNINPRPDGLARTVRIVDREPLDPNETIANPPGQEVVLNAYGAAYLSVLPTAVNSTVSVHLRTAQHGPPRFRVFTVDSTGTPSLVSQCAQEFGSGAGKIRRCASDAAGNVSLDIGTSSGATAVKEILIVASASAQPVSFTYQIGPGEPVIDLKTPSQGQPVWAGKLDGTPRPFLVELAVRSKDGKSIPGLKESQIRLSVVNGTTVTVLTDVRLMPLSGGVYLGRATLPASAIPSTATNLSLKAEYLDQTGNTVLASDIHTQALAVGNSWSTVSTEMVLDLSFSMAGTKIEAVKQAAKFLLDTIPDGDELGIVRYIHDAKSLAPIEVLDATKRNALKNTIDGLQPSGCTSIGDGLLEAQSNFKLRFSGASAPRLNILLMTDGIANANHFPAYYYSNEYVAKALPGGNRDGAGQSSGCTINDPDPNDTEDWAAGSLNWHDQSFKPFVNSIGFGQDADLVELQNIASSTGGLFVYADEGGVGTTHKSTHELADGFTRGYGAAAGVSRIAAVRAADIGALPTFTVESGADRLQVSLLSLATPPSDDLRLKRQGGTESIPKASGNNKAAVFRVDNPAAGTWYLALDVPPQPPVPMLTGEKPKAAADATASDDPPVFVEAVVRSSLVLLAVADVEDARSGGFNVDDERWVGKDVFVRAIPTDGNDMTGVTITGTVRDPAGATSSITLLDDGLHSDGAANDGIYGTVIAHPSLVGAYNVDLTATGSTANLGSFKRSATVGFSLHAAPDGDVDTVPDYCDPKPTVPDANEDPDHDGLTNAQECAIGTNPLNSDSDAGGEDDGPEVAAGHNPKDPSDDRVRPFLIQASPCKGKVLITPEVPISGNVEILVSNVGLLGPYSLAYSGPVGASLKIAAPTGNEKCYRMKVLGSGGTAWSPPVCLSASTSKNDPLPPILRVTPANGPWAGKHRVELLVSAFDGPDASSRVPRCTEVTETGVKEVQISFTQDFSGAPWQPYTERVSVDIPPGRDASDIWVRVRDGAGNVSEPVFTTVQLGNTPGTDFLIFGVTGARLEDGVTLIGADGKRGRLASQGAEAVDIGAQATSGDVISLGGVFLRAGGRIEGDVETAQGFSKQTGAIVTGTVVESARVRMTDLPGIFVQPGTGAPVDLERGQVRVLPPGNYGNVTLKSGSKLTLQSGTYQMGIVLVEPDAQLILNKASGPCRIYMESFTHRGKVLESGGAYGQTLFAVLGTTPVFIEGPFIGTLLAPVAAATIGNSTASEHRGAFHAGSVVVRSRTTLYHVPWNYNL